MISWLPRNWTALRRKRLIPSLRRLLLITLISLELLKMKLDKVLYISYILFLVKDEKSFARLENKVSILESNLIDLKNIKKNTHRSHQLINITPEYTEKFDILVDEVN